MPRQAPPETVAAIHAAVARGLQPLRPLEHLSLSAWAEDNFVLSEESSHEQGTWHCYPFQRGWMDWFSDDRIEEVTVRKSKRVGYTKTLLAFIAYNAAHRRRKQALWQPTDDDRDSFVKTEIDPMLRDVAAMRPVLRASSKDDTLRMKQFLGSVLHTLGGKAARAYRRITVSVAMLDEASAFDLMIEKALDPIEGARGRLEGAAFPKLIAGSTPRVKGIDHIETREQNADALMRYHVACPHCGVDHPLTWSAGKHATGLRWHGDEPDTAHHVCPHCHAAISQADYLRVYPMGEWVSACGSYRYGQDATWRDAAGMPCHPPRHVALHIWAAYSPQRTWADIVREYLQASAKQAAGESGPLITFTNETLGECWAEVFEKSDEHELSRRAEPYRRFTVPIGGLVLVTGIDVQDDRFEAVTWAIGRGEEMWCVDYSVIYANPADQREWDDKLDAYLETPFTHAAGTTLKIAAAAVDTGGHYTHQAYNYCRTREHRRVFAVKGDSLPGRPVKGKASMQDCNWRGQVLKRGVRLWLVGTDTAKDLLHGRLSVQPHGPGHVHFSADLPPEFYHQLTAEARVPQRAAGGVIYRWVNIQRRRNEVLDCTVYALWCTHMLGLHLRSEAEWLRLESVIQPATPDLFAGGAAAQQPAIASRLQPAQPIAVGSAADAPAAAREPWLGPGSVPAVLPAAARTEAARPAFRRPW